MNINDRPDKRHRNPPWSEIELILALDLYSRRGIVDDTHREVRRLSEILNELNVQQDRPDRLRFRNPNGVALKLANFAALDPGYPGKGMRRGGKLDSVIWQRYAGNEDLVSSIAKEIVDSSRFESPDPSAPDKSEVVEVDIEEQHVETYAVSKLNQTIEATRKEQRLVLDYAEYLTGRGHRVKRHLYAVPGQAGLLACDLVDLTDQTLYEAKSDVKRNSVRLAIGQLLDYRRFEPKDMHLAVLLPRWPAPDLRALASSVPASTVWRTNDGWAVNQH